MAKWLYIVIPFGLGILAYNVMQPSYWHSVRQGLILLLSIFGGAVLVRMARGIPISDTNYLQLKDVHKLTQAVSGVYRALMVLFAAIVISIVGLAFVELLHDILIKMDDAAKWGVPLSQLITGLLVTLIAYALGRTVAVLLGDYDLVKLQGKIMNDVATRRHADQRAESLKEAASEEPFTGHEGYGKLRE